jgi:hypothetical protein
MDSANVPRIVSMAFAVSLLGTACDPAEDDGHGDDHPTTVDPCDDPRVDDFRVGATKAGDAVQIEIIDATPAEPVRGDNAWTVLFTDMSGMPLEDFAVDVVPWMPDHGHGTQEAPQITQRGAGEVQVDSMHLHMAGLWDVRFNVTPEGGASETVVLTVCVK